VDLRASKIDVVNEFRVQSPEEFEQGLSAALPAANLAIAAAAVYLVRRGAGFGKAT
jgi:hypothetical protein